MMASIPMLARMVLGRGTAVMVATDMVALVGMVVVMAVAMAADSADAHAFAATYRDWRRAYSSMEHAERLADAQTYAR